MVKITVTTPTATIHVEAPNATTLQDYLNATQTALVTANVLDYNTELKELVKQQDKQIDLMIENSLQAMVGKTPLTGL